MSKQQWTWEPVENELIHIHDTASVDQYTVEYGTYLEVNNTRDTAGARLPDDLRLCRRVPAPAQGVPEEVREALRVAIQLAEIASDWNLSEVEIDGEMVRTWDIRNQLKSALDAQEQQRDE